MKLIALMLVRNEEWILRCSLDAALRWCDCVCVLDHASTDRTPSIVGDLQWPSPGRIRLSRWPEATRWDEMEQRQQLLEMGRTAGGTHFAMIDADEILTANLLSAIRPMVEALPPHAVLDLPMIPVWHDLDHYRSDGSVWSTGIMSTAVADAPALAWKTRGLEGYEHHNRVPAHSTRATAVRVEGGVMHLQWASWRRVVSKHRWYGILERCRWPEYDVAGINSKYAQAIAEEHPTRAPIPAEWWGDYRRNEIRLDLEPWMDEDSRRMLKTHAPEYFAGLDLRGWTL